VRRSVRQNVRSEYSMCNSKCQTTTQHRDCPIISPRMGKISQGTGRPMHAMHDTRHVCMTCMCVYMCMYAYAVNQAHAPRIHPDNLCTVLSLIVPDYQASLFSSTPMPR
jgi:hypothetical protein